MSRLQVANELGVVEGTLRAAEDRGDIPRYAEATRSSYRDVAFVWLAARAGGASPESIRKVMGSFNRGGGEEVRSMSQQSTYAPYRLFHIVEPDGTPVRDEKRQVQLLAPHFLRGVGRDVAIPRGSASDFELPAAAKDARWWGSEGNQWFGDELVRFGLFPVRFEPPTKGGSK